MICDTEQELKQRIRKKDHFISRVFDSQKIFIKGNQDELERFEPPNAILIVCSLARFATILMRRNL
jgi:hypothetical protein